MSKQIKRAAVGLSNENLPELLLRVCKAYDVSQKDIQSPSESKILVKARKAFACSAWMHGVSTHKISTVLGNKDRSVIASYIRQS